MVGAGKSFRFFLKSIFLYSYFTSSKKTASWMRSSKQRVAQKISSTILRIQRLSHLPAYRQLFLASPAY